MLVLSRKPDQAIHLGDDIVVVVLEIRGNRVCLGIAAPADVNIRRSELELQSPRAALVDPVPAPRIAALSST